MQLVKNVLGLAAFLCVSLSIVLAVLYPAELWLCGSIFLVGCLCALAWLILNRARVKQFLLRKSTRYGANALLIVFLVLGILTFANILTKQFSWRKDITRQGLNSLSPQTVKVLQDLKEPVKAYYFFKPADREKGETILKNYARETKHLKYELVDGTRERTRVKAMGVTKYDSFVLEKEGGAKKILVEGSTEEKLTNGLIRLLKSQTQTIYFTQGHGEPALSAESGQESYALLKAEIEKEAYIAKPLVLVAEGKIPEDASAVVVAGPRSAFLPKELEILKNWVAKGGKAIFAFTVDITAGGLAPGSRQLAQLAAEYGVAVNDKMLVDPTSQASKVEPSVLFAMAASKESPIVKDFPTSSQQILLNFLFPVSVNLQRTERPREGWKLEQLVKSTPKAWAESDWAALRAGSVSYNAAKDKQGELDLAVATEDTKGKTKVVFFGTPFFVMNNFLQTASNRDLFMNSLAWLTSNEELIAIRAKVQDDTQPLNVNQGLMQLIFLITVIVIPVFILGTGLWIWWGRRGR